MLRLTQVHAQSLREQIVEQIRNAIIEGRLNLGDRITEIQLTEELGVSRTPVREALIVLESEGLVVSAPNRSTMVRTFSERDVDQIFSMRTALENFAGELILDRLGADDYQRMTELVNAQKRAIQQNDLQIVRRVDMSFHRMLIERSEHALLIRQWTEIVAQIAALLYLRAEAIRDYDETQSIKDHTAILNAYQYHNLAELHMLNVQINLRVAAECRLGVVHRANRVLTESS
jgi:DNA-binding GntR family transcriptional regulator